MALTNSATGTYGTVTVGATPVLIVDGTTLRRNVAVQNLHASQILYIGTDSNVATTTGWKVAPGTEKTIDGYSGPLYGVASGADTDIRYLEIGN